MIPLGLLRVVILTEAALLAAAAAVIMVRALWLRRRERVAEARLEWARPRLADALSSAGEKPDEATVVELRTLRPWARTMLLEELGPSLSGQQRSCMARMAGDLGLESREKRRCRSRLWSRRLLGAYRLTAYGCDVPLRLLSDRHVAVRAQAVEWAGDRPSEDLAATLAEMLADPSSLVRYAAQDSLLRSGPAAVEPIAAYLEVEADRDSGKTAVGTAAALEVAAWRANPRYEPAARQLAGHHDGAVRAGAATLLGALGGTGGTDLLGGLLTDPVPDVREAVVASLGRLQHWPAAPAVAARLGDEVWEVRRAAAHALLAMGSPGVVLLRRALTSESATVSVLAQYALDVAVLR